MHAYVCEQPKWPEVFHHMWRENQSMVGRIQRWFFWICLTTADFLHFWLFKIGSLTRFKVILKRAKSFLFLKKRETLLFSKCGPRAVWTSNRVENWDEKAHFPEFLVRWMVFQGCRKSFFPPGVGLLLRQCCASLLVGWRKFCQNLGLKVFWGHF